MKRLGRSAGGILATAVVLVAACGGATRKGGSPQGLPVSKDAFPAALARAFCTHFAPCCSQAHIPFDEAACEKRTTASAMTQVAGDGYSTYDPAAGGRCVAYMEQLASSCGVPPLDPSSRFHDERVCSHDLFTGDAPPGAACAYGNDCAQPASCDPVQPATADGTFAHVCVSRPHGKAGEACVGFCTITQGSGPEECSPTPGPPGAYCYLEDDLHCAADGTCHADGPGAACSSDSPCNDTAFCNPRNVCEALGTAGAECTDSSQCQRALYCDGGTHRCKQRLLPFSSCTSDDQCSGDPRRCVDGHCAFHFDYLCTGQPAPSAN